MLDDLTRERLAGWASDVEASDALADLPGAVTGQAGSILAAFFEAACAHRELAPEDWELVDLRAALLGRVARLGLGEAVHAAVPDLCRAALAELEAQGRVADGRALGLELATSRAAYGRATRGEVESLTRPGAKIGRNDPCPCRSGKKYKACCLRKAG